MLGDLLFSFNGRTGKIGYLISLFCTVSAVAGLFMLQKLIEDWKFASIVITTLSVLPLVMYLAATSKRFQDRGQHPLIGFFSFYILPIAIFLGAHSVLGEAFINPQTISEELQTLHQQQWTQTLLLKWGAIGSIVLFFTIGQISLLFGNSVTSNDLENGYPPNNDET